MIFCHSFQRNSAVILFSSFLLFQFPQLFCRFSLLFLIIESSVLTQRSLHLSSISRVTINFIFATLQYEEHQFSRSVFITSIQLSLHNFDLLTAGLVLFNTQCHILFYISFDYRQSLLFQYLDILDH